VGLTELATHDVEFMEAKLGASNKRLQKSKQLAKKQERRE
jgi:hypothetical protein